MLQLPQRLRLDLPDPFPRHAELLADFFQRVVRVHADAEPHPQHTFLARRQRGQNPRRRFLQVLLNRGIQRQDGVLVFDEIAKLAVFLVANRRFQEIGSLAIFITLRTFSSGICSFSASSSGVGSRPISCSIWRPVRTSLLIVSIMWTGMRIVRAWSAMRG